MPIDERLLANPHHYVGQQVTNELGRKYEFRGIIDGTAHVKNADGRWVFLEHATLDAADEMIPKNEDAVGNPVVLVWDRPEDKPVAEKLLGVVPGARFPFKTYDEDGVSKGWKFCRLVPKAD
jgi:hypothetical protein